MSWNYRSDSCLLEIYVIKTSGNYQPIVPRQKHSIVLSPTVIKKNSIPFFLQILTACLFDTSLAKSEAANFTQRPFSLSASLGFHGPPLFTFKTDRLDFRGLDRG